MLPNRQGLLMGLVVAIELLMPATAAPAQSTRSAPGEHYEAPFVVTVLADGRPVPHAWVCTSHEEWAESSFRATEMWDVGRHRYARPAVSDTNGVARLPFKDVFDFEQDKRVLYAYDPASGRVALTKLDPKMAARHISLAMEPSCEVWGTITCPLLEEHATAFKHHTFLNWAGAQLVLTSNGVDGHFQFVLPPGQYELRIGGCGKGAGPAEFGRERQLVPFGGIPLEELTVKLSIAPGQRRAEVGPVRLAPTPLGKLVGAPAPELDGIVDWKNSPPLKLAGLPGKVVLLDFWSYSCGSCIAEMPSWTDLYDKYKAYGLLVIGIHDNQAKSVAEMDGKLARARSEFWHGRDLPFPVAIDGGGPNGPHARYHVDEWPTVVLIDQQGRLAHVVDGSSMWIEPLVRQMLGLPAHADGG